MARPFNVLVFPGGTEIGLEVRAALGWCKEIDLSTAGVDTSNHAPYAYRRHFTVPGVFESGWIDHLNEILLTNSIDFIVPAYDDVLFALAGSADQIKAGIVSSPIDTCQITRFKSKTYEYMNGVVPTPAVYKSPSEVLRYPVFTKPDRGQGSQGTSTIGDSDS